MPSRDSALLQRQHLRCQQRDQKSVLPGGTAFYTSGRSSRGGRPLEKKRLPVACVGTAGSAAPAAAVHDRQAPSPRTKSGGEREVVRSSSSSFAASSSSPAPPRATAAALFRSGAAGGAGGRFAAACYRPAAVAAAASVLSLLCLSSPLFCQPAAAVVLELRSGSSQCFYAPINQAPWSLQGRFESFVGEDTATLTIDGPVPSPDPKQPLPTAKPQMLFSSSKESAPFKLTITLPGTYRLCTTNRVNYTQTVALNFHLLPPAVAAGTSAAAPGEPGSSSSGDGSSAAAALPPDMSSLVLSTHTDKLRDLSNKVVELANALFDQQSTALARLSVYERLNSSTRSRATFWKVLQMGVQIVLSGIQVYAVRSRFEVKTIV